MNKAINNALNKKANFRPFEEPKFEKAPCYRHQLFHSKHQCPKCNAEEWNNVFAN
jgi:hypothetical protein